MHDLVHDLARWASGGTCFHLQDTSRANNQLGSLKKVRHLSYAWNYLDGIYKFQAISEIEQIDERLRTFLPFPANEGSWYHYLSQTIVSELLPKFKKLRMLSLESYQITELPESIGGLRHLRYLNLSSTRVKSLLESTSFLVNLLILKLKDCSNLKKLPSKIRNLTKLRYLDIRGVNLDEMPLGINKLKCLRYLSDFVVGKGVGATLKDLKNFKSLCGDLRLSGLSNAVDLHETSKMILNDKQKLRVLGLEWNSQFKDTRNEESEKKVLDLLCPHPNLERLKIKSYCGIEFPSWVGDASFSKLTTVTLTRCYSCTRLPSLGLLGSLKDLTIKRMNGLKRIGKEFHGQRCSRPFHSLETLCFKDLQEWEQWEPIKENDCDGAFLCLREFSVINCPKLCGILPNCLPSLEKFVVENCEQLVVSLSSLPKLSNLNIDGCREIACNSPIDLRSLKYMTFSNTSHEQLSNLWPMNGAFLERPPWQVQNFISITDLQITCCSDLVSFLEVCFFSNLCKLEISDCNALTSLPVEMNKKNACLESLKIERCDSLRFIVNGQLPSSLKRLEIVRCAKLEYLWDDREISWTSTLDEENLSLLEHLYVDRCVSLTNLSSSGRLSATLSTLIIRGVPELVSIADSFHNNKSLEEISLTGCTKLKAVPKGLYNLTRLREIKIEDCQSIVNFAKDGLPKGRLRELSIINCEKLEALPKGFQSLDSLKTLRLYECPSMRSFPEEGFPTNLTSLEIIGEVNIYKPLLEWGLHNLISLTTLRIYSHPKAESSFPEQEMGMRLPPSLTHLHIYKFTNMNCLLSQGFRNLTSLETLEIRGCPDLTSFPKLALPSSLTCLCIYYCLSLTSISELSLPSSLLSLHIRGCPGLTSVSELALPSSLQSLSISKCPGLTSISEQRLPSSLLELHIDDCPRLKEECKRNKGKEWPNISHIPCSKIDWTSIYELEDEELMRSRGFRLLMEESAFQFCSASPALHWTLKLA